MKPPAPDRLRSDFLFLLFMSQHMPRAQLAALIDDRIAAIDAKLEHMESCSEQVVDRGHRFVFELGRTYYRFVRDYLDRNKSWLVSEEPADPAELAAG
jgi:hypothetical protein